MFYEDSIETWPIAAIDQLNAPLDTYFLIRILQISGKELFCKLVDES